MGDERVKRVVNKRPMNDIPSSVVFGSQPCGVDIGRRRLIIFPAELWGKDVLPPAKLPLKLGCRLG